MYKIESLSLIHLFKQTFLLFVLTKNRFQAQAHVHQKKFNEAEEILLTIMEQTNSSRREVLHQLANLYSHINRTADAVRYIQLALDTCTPTDLTCAPIHAFHGDLAKDMNDLNSAILVRIYYSLCYMNLRTLLVRGITPPKKNPLDVYSNIMT